MLLTQNNSLSLIKCWPLKHPLWLQVHTANKCKVHEVPNDAPDESYLQIILHVDFKVPLYLEEYAVMEQEVEENDYPCDG